MKWYALAEIHIRMQRCYSIDLDYKERWHYNKTQYNVFLQGVKINPHLLNGNFLKTPERRTFCIYRSGNEVQKT